MRKQLLGLCFACACFLPAVGQQGADARDFRLPLRAQVEMRAIQVDYHPLLVRMEAPFPGGDAEKAWLAEYKAGLMAKYRYPDDNLQKVDSTAPSPWKGDNFASNHVINGVPNDNDMAISNGGKIVSVINSNIYMHDEFGATLMGNVSLDAWSAPLGLTGDKFDPRALYDPIHDRFIIACLNGFLSSTSYIIVGFSQTNDPTGAWNLYALPGDPNLDTLWTDYPIMALTEHELFLTGNLLYDNQPWQTGFNQSICWQIDLDNAYAGDSLETRLWYNIQFGGAPIRNLCPIQAGSSPTGTNLYLLSNRNFSAGNDTVFILEITDTMNAAGAQFLVDYGISNVHYSLAPNAMQQFNQQLATNDARWLDGFIENGTIQFVGNCLDTATGRAGFYHGIIEDVTGLRTVTGKVIGNPSGDYGYPAIAWMGMNAADNDALLAINYCGTTAATRAGCGGIYYDGSGGYSPLVVAKGGASYIDAINGVDRWGDYTGVQRRYNENGVVWMAGTFGKSNRLPGTWIAEFHHPLIVDAEPIPPADAFEAVAYPNPAIDMMFVEFGLDADAFLDISIWDAQGRLVKTLLRDRVRAGTNRIHFSTQPLAAGIYYLRIADSEKVLSEKKIVRVQ
jgi:hypothetical protein